jgi:hypothetical protein
MIRKATEKENQKTLELEASILQVMVNHPEGATTQEIIAGLEAAGKAPKGQVKLAVQYVLYNSEKFERANPGQTPFVWLAKKAPTKKKAPPKAIKKKPVEITPADERKAITFSLMVADEVYRTLSEMAEKSPKKREKAFAEAVLRKAQTSVNTRIDTMRVRNYIGGLLG